MSGPATDRHGSPSPCINVCQMDGSSGWCTGCLRTIDEIAGWSSMSEPERAAVLAALPQRRTLRRQRTAQPWPSPPAGA